MENRWADLCARLSADNYECAGYADIAIHYSRDPDFYHTLEHIEHCLEEFDQAKHLTQNPDAVELALWYHDIVYDRHGKDNEEKSAAFLLHVAECAGFPKDTAQQAAKLILATKHAEIQVDLDAQLIADIDLAILGQPEVRFDEYERQVRSEYDWVPEAEFSKGRSEILKSFLNRSSIYFTEFFQAKYETQARNNLKRSLDKLLTAKQSAV
jgi:predicted metal-dependent HD superfamily phosphohydrolase